LNIGQGEMTTLINGKEIAQDLRNNLKLSISNFRLVLKSCAISLPLIRVVISLWPIFN